MLFFPPTSSENIISFGGGGVCLECVFSSHGLCFTSVLCEEVLFDSREVKGCRWREIKMASEAS